MKSLSLLVATLLFALWVVSFYPFYLFYQRLMEKARAQEFVPRHAPAFDARALQELREREITEARCTREPAWLAHSK